MGFVVVQRGLETRVVQEAAGVFHRGEQRRLGVGLRRFYLPLHQEARAPLRGIGMAFAPVARLTGMKVARRGVLLVFPAVMLLGLRGFDALPSEGDGVGLEQLVKRESASLIRRRFGWLSS